MSANLGYNNSKIHTLLDISRYRICFTWKTNEGNISKRWQNNKPRKTIWLMDYYNIQLPFIVIFLTLSFALPLAKIKFSWKTYFSLLWAIPEDDEICVPMKKILQIKSLMHKEWISIRKMEVNWATGDSVFCLQTVVKDCFERWQEPLKR